jgi:hypothetical protein
MPVLRCREWHRHCTAWHGSQMLPDHTLSTHDDPGVRGAADCQHSIACLEGRGHCYRKNRAVTAPPAGTVLSPGQSPRAAAP